MRLRFKGHLVRRVVLTVAPTVERAVVRTVERTVVPRAQAIPTAAAGPRLVAVHHGECTVGQSRVRPVTRRAAIEALIAGVEACALCHPDRELEID